MECPLTCNRFLAASIVLALSAAVSLPPAGAATLRHKDGTKIEGKIVHETPDQIRIETSYGTLNYSKEELTGIERDGPVGGAPTPRINYAAVIPAGPVNPVNPPQVPPLVQFAARPTTATASALPGAAAPAGVPTPVAPAVPAGPAGLPQPTASSLPSLPTESK